MARKQKSIPNQNTSLRARAYAHIQRGIASGALRPETVISEVPLARELKMSRTPVREAMNQLVSEGLLEQVPNRGTIVVNLRRQDVIELYELREALEVYAVRKAALLTLQPAELEQWRGFAEEIRNLRKELQESVEKILSAEQMRRFITSDLSFHNMLIRMAANARILKVLSDTRLLIRIFGIEQPDYNSETLERIYKQHVAIIDAVVKHDAELATQLLTSHIRNSLDERLQAFDTWERERFFLRSMPDYLYPAGR